MLRTNRGSLCAVVAAYSSSLRITFAGLIIFGVVNVALVLPIRLPEEDVTDED